MKQFMFASEQKRGTLQPSLTIASLYGEECIYSPKLYSTDYSHFSSDILSLEALTGRELAVSGNIPVICHKGSVTEAGMRLLKKAGLELPANLYTYQNEMEYVQILKDLESLGQSVIFQYPHPEETFSPSLHWIHPEVHAYLCDKRSIPELVPEGHYPVRRLTSLEELREGEIKLPFVLKSGDGRPTSGGCGVMFIENIEQLDRIDESFCDLSQLIIEEHIVYDENISVHYAVDSKGEITFLGKSEQIVNNDGCFRGSWLTSGIEDHLAPIVETGYLVMENLAGKGYIGIAGFDVLVRGEEAYFIDLNVRFNASSCGLMLYKAIQDKYQKEVVRLCNLEWNRDFPELVPVAEKYIDSEQFIPLTFLDASWVDCFPKISKAVGLVIGHSIAEVESILCQMAADGLLHRE